MALIGLVGGVTLTAVLAVFIVFASQTACLVRRLWGLTRLVPISSRQTNIPRHDRDRIPEERLASTRHSMVITYA